MLTKSIEVMKYVRASAGRANLAIAFEDRNEPRHDGKTIYLPRITYHTTDLELKQLQASVDHEVAHDLYSSFDVLKDKKLNPKGLLMFVWNFLEDSRVNNIEAKQYLGFRENWDECSSVLIQKILAKSKHDAKTISKITKALICWDAAVSASHFPMIELIASKVTPNKKIFDVLNNYTDRLVSCCSILDKEIGTRATYDLAVDILNELDEKCKEELKNPEEVKKDLPKETKVSGDVSKESSEDEGETKTKKDEYKIIKVELTEEDLAAMSLTMPEHGEEMGKVGINFDPVKCDGDWDLTDYSEFVVVNYPKNIGDEKYFQSAKRFLEGYEEQVGSKLISQENFAQQVRRLIQIKAKVQTQYGTKKGKLDQSRLSRICFNAPGFNERVFKNKIENKLLDAAITVLVDMSGSMGGQKVFNALASTLLVNEVCSTLNIPLEIIGFTDGYSSTFGGIKPIMYIYKSFSDLKVSSDSLREYFAYSSNHMSGNPDGENILWAYDRLAKRKERKKLLIVMSDGSPAASKSCMGIGEFTHKVIEEIEASKSVDIYGLGLCSDSVQYYYKAHSVVSKPEEIPSKLIELIERKIVNGS
jgi:cobalamin biosynthesis protein CobT